MIYVAVTVKKTYLKRSAIFSCRLFWLHYPPPPLTACKGRIHKEKTDSERGTGKNREIKAEAFFRGGGGLEPKIR
jgi:hypothetical protein